jgi:hypothetical protein
MCVFSRSYDGWSSALLGPKRTKVERGLNGVKGRDG